MALLISTACSQKAVEQESQDVIAEPVVEEISGEKSAPDPEEYQRGIDALSVRDYALARIIFAQFAEKNPQLSGAYLNLALIDFKQEHFDSCEQFVAKVIELNPRQAQAYHLRALLNQQKGDIRRAEQDYTTAIELDPEYPIAHYNLALLYDIFLQDLPLAIRHYSIYLDLLDREDEATADWIQHLKNSLDNG